MSKIDELLKNEKVEWKKLGEIAEITVISPKRKLKKNEYLEEGLYPIIDQGQNFIVGYTNDNSAIFDKHSYVIFGDHTEILKYVDFQFAQGADGIKVLKTDENYINSRYLYHAILNFYKITGNYKRHFSLLKEIQIPIPSIETQEKIVKTLDKFTNYVTELQAELHARTKQYEYYRDMLLSEEYLNKISKEVLDLVVNKAKLNQIARIIRGKRLVKSELFVDGQYPVFQNSLIPLGYYNEKNFDGGKTCVIGAGAAGEIFYEEKDFWAADDIFVITSDKVLNKYLYYFLLNKQCLLKSKVRKASIPRLSREEVERVEVLFPPIEIQNKIVEILDKFQSLLADTRGLLPKEIEQRQKQYEYYREKLLTFDVSCAKHTHTHTHTQYNF